MANGVEGDFEALNTRVDVLEADLAAKLEVINTNLTSITKKLASNFKKEMAAAGSLLILGVAATLGLASWADNKFDRLSDNANSDYRALDAKIESKYQSLDTDIDDLTKAINRFELLQRDFSNQSKNLSESQSEILKRLADLQGAQGRTETDTDPVLARATEADDSLILIEELYRKEGIEPPNVLAPVRATLTNTGFEGAEIGMSMSMEDIPMLTVKAEDFPAVAMESLDANDDGLLTKEEATGSKFITSNWAKFDADLNNEISTEELLTILE